MNLQAPLGCPVMLAIDRALNDDLLDNDLHRKTAAAGKTNDFARLEVLSARCDQDVDNSTKTFHAFLTSRVTGPGDSLVSLVPVILCSLRTILIWNFVPRSPLWITISQ